MSAPTILSDLRVSRGRDRFRIRASGSRVVVSFANPLSAWRIGRALGPERERLSALLEQLGLLAEVRCLGLRLARLGYTGS